MKKQLVPLFIMSIISIVFSVVTLGIGIWAIVMQNDLFEPNEENGDAFTALISVFGSVIILLLAISAMIAFAATALLGTFGLVSTLKNGRFSIVCLILGSIATIITLMSIPTMLEDIMNDFNPIGLIPFVYCGTYTACAIIAFMYRKKVVHEQIMEKPCDFATKLEENKL
ncbi:MAG: hypothetical protein IKK42_03875 [Oscillospiraceae bacterium]|nr:hypothetical protein [Oscillospiraceae bacterium]